MEEVLGGNGEVHEAAAAAATAAGDAGGLVCGGGEDGGVGDRHRYGDVETGFGDDNILLSHICPSRNRGKQSVL